MGRWWVMGLLFWWRAVSSTRVRPARWACCLWRVARWACCLWACCLWPLQGWKKAVCSFFYVFGSGEISHFLSYFLRFRRENLWIPFFGAKRRKDFWTPFPRRGAPKFIFCHFLGFFYVFYILTVLGDYLFLALFLWSW